MHERFRVLWTIIAGLALGGLVTTADAGMVGLPVARLQPLAVRLELAGDSFKEELQNTGDASATTGRALFTLALGLTNWSEVFGRVGTAEFNIDEALFSGNFGFAFGGGVRIRLFSLSFGSVGVSGQYLRFTSNDDNSAGAKVEGEWEEFDVALGFGTKRVGAFAFYLGGVFHHSEITLETSDSVARTTLESEIPFRLLLGSHIFPLVDVPSGDLVINVEIRLIGETPQFTLGIQYAF